MRHIDNWCNVRRAAVCDYRNVCLGTNSPYNLWHLEKFWATLHGRLYLENLRGATLAEHPVCWSQGSGYTLWVPKGSLNGVSPNKIHLKEALQQKGTTHCPLRLEYSSPQIKLYSYLKNRFKKSVSVLVSQWCKSVGMVIFIIFTANGFVLRNGVKGAILESSETAFSKGNQLLLSLGQILMQTTLAPIFCDIFSGRYFSFWC